MSMTALEKALEAARVTYIEIETALAVFPQNPDAWDSAEDMLWDKEWMEKTLKMQESICHRLSVSVGGEKKRKDKA